MSKPFVSIIDGEWKYGETDFYLPRPKPKPRQKRTTPRETVKILNIDGILRRNHERLRTRNTTATSR